MASGLGHLRFRCTGCGNCCRDLRVPLTDADLRRVIDATGRPASQIVAWLPTDSVDLIGEPGSLVLLDHEGGLALMVLAQRDGACVFLDAQERCDVYDARPGNCRLYPFAASFGRRGGIRRLRLLGGTECDHARDGDNDAHALRRSDERRWAEHRSYLERISRWNRAQRHRSLLGHRLRGAPEFLAFLGFADGERALARAT
ncbi:MAG TPA: YkgJ family cysteine cluster protein [Polyangiaceae bacterium]|jgi:Fe-S-cluster containining protein|nr:YkgJ family cysteine cluster protein [Polyangiaceae bacterium]